MSKRDTLWRTGWGSIATMIATGSLAAIAVSLICGAGSQLNAATPAKTVAASSATSSESPTPKAATESATPAETKPGNAKSAAALPAQTEYINEMMRKSWTDHKLTPSALASDNEWCRRVYLDLIGRVPKVEELNKFLGDRTPNRKANLVDRLLGDEYQETYANNWGGIWTNLLIGRAKSKRDEERSPTNREGMEQYLRNAFGRNKSYKKMVYELVSATGSNKLDDPASNGAVNFLIGKMEDNGIQATAKTAQIFLGLSVQCTQCHNHPFNEWKQNSFWEMNAFFRQTKMAKTMSQGKNVDHAILKNEDFRGEGSDIASAELFYDLRNGIMKAAFPVFVDGTAISRSGALQQIDRRTELAKMITKSDYMSRAIVSRMWGHFMGYAFTKPVEDMGPHNPPTHPELLNKLADDFSKHQYEDDGYDLKKLMKWIVLSEPYGLSSRFAKNRMDDPALGEKPSFSHFYLRQMSAEQVYDSMVAATGVDEKLSEAEQKATKDRWLSQFVIAFGTDDGGEASTFNGSIPQALMMFNGELVKKAVSGDRGTLLEKVADSPKLSIKDKVAYLYMAGLSRKPNNAEMLALEESTETKKSGGPATRVPAVRPRNSEMAAGNDLVKLKDCWWAILNSNEFIINH